MSYKIFTDTDETFELIKPSIQAATTYVKSFVKWAPVSFTKRSQVAQLFGIVAEVTDEVLYLDYQKQRAKLLFPSQAKEIDKRLDFLNVAEVDRAEINFSDATQLPLREPETQFGELQDFLQDLTSAMEKIDSNLTITRSTE